MKIITHTILLFLSLFLASQSPAFAFNPPNNGGPGSSQTTGSGRQDSAGAGSR